MMMRRTLPSHQDLTARHIQSGSDRQVDRLESDRQMDRLESDRQVDRLESDRSTQVSQSDRDVRDVLPVLVDRRPKCGGGGGVGP